MKIIIVGAGIAGLSLFLHLRKHLPGLPSSNISILERHAHASSTQEDSPSTFNGGLGIAPNGMRVLRRLDPSLHELVRAAGFPSVRYEMRTAAGTLLGILDAVSETPTTEASIMISRRRLWDLLRAAVKQESPDAINEGVGASQIKEDGTVELTDGTTVHADLIIGADGVRSVCREAVVDEGESGRDPEFQTLMNVGGDLPGSVCSSTVMTFGAAGFFGYTPCSSSLEGSKAGEVGMWWSTYTDTQANPTTTNKPRDSNLGLTLRDRHKDCVDPIIQAVLRDVTRESEPQDAKVGKATLSLHTPTWIIRKAHRWARGSIILIGDAAHALPSTSGQGVSQALEDTATLAMLLSREADSSSTVLIDKAKQRVGASYEKLRMARVNRILNEALQMQSKKNNMSWLESKVLFSFLWILFRFTGGKSDSWKYDYDVQHVLETA